MSGAFFNSHLQLIVVVKISLCWRPFAWRDHTPRTPPEEDAKQAPYAASGHCSLVTTKGFCELLESWVRVPASGIEPKTY